MGLAPFAREWPSMSLKVRKIRKLITRDENLE